MTSRRESNTLFQVLLKVVLGTTYGLTLTAVGCSTPLPVLVAAMVYFTMRLKLRRPIRMVRTFVAFFPMLLHEPGRLAPPPPADPLKETGPYAHVADPEKIT